MKILGIETSCDDTAVAVVEAKGGFRKPSFSVLANISYSQIAIHQKFGGIVPNLASRAHLEKIGLTIEEALKKAKLEMGDIDLISVTKGPGLIPSLLIGVNTARALAYRFAKPIIGVNHIEAHIHSNWLSPITNVKAQMSNVKTKKIQFPTLILIVSGGHTELILMKDYGKYKIIGETLDDAAGEAFDKTARLLDLGFIGGPAIAAEAAKFLISKSEFLNKSQISNPKIFLPRPMINSKDYNFSFSGLKTAVLYLFNDLIKKYPIEEFRPELANEVEQAIVDVLVSKTVKAAKKFNPKIVMIAGGVSANKKLREELAKKLSEIGIPFLAPDFSFSTDNAAMIAAAGYINFIIKKPSANLWKKLKADANLRL